MFAKPLSAQFIWTVTAHAKGKSFPVYKTEGRTGSEHEPTFKMSVSIQGIETQFGEGRNKKLAEQEAACKMLAKLGYKHE